VTLVDRIISRRSLSIVGMAKNTGKTECLNYLVEKLHERGKRVGLTSVGLDGERVDQVTRTRKPEIKVREQTVFVTSERHYREKRLVAEILEVSDRQTALGRLVTARAVTPGTVILSGPSDTRSLREWIDGAERFGVDISLAEGALSRLSPGSPAVAEGLILATGAAVSGDISRLTRETCRVRELTRLEAVDEETRRKLSGIEQGVWGIDEEGNASDLQIPSALLLEQHKERIFSRGVTLFVAGVVNDALLRFAGMREGVTVIARDFTRVFAGEESLRVFARNGGKLRVLLRSELVAVCINPLSPRGYRLDSDALAEALWERLGVPVYDVKRMDEYRIWHG
jgi:hypothetical protein